MDDTRRNTKEDMGASSGVNWANWYVWEAVVVLFVSFLFVFCKLTNTHINGKASGLESGQTYNEMDFSVFGKLPAPCLRCRGCLVLVVGMNCPMKEETDQDIRE